MEIHPQLLIFGGSLIAIFALAGLAKLLQLGGTAMITDERDARRLASEVEDGFAADRIAIDQEGSTALISDAGGRIMLIKRHGNQFAGRVLGKGARAEIAAGTLYIDSGEARFGSASLEHVDAASWADAINRLNEPPDA